MKCLYILFILINEFLWLCQTELSTKPHIVFVIIDDYGYNDIGYHAQDEGSAIKTPFLDSLASAGVKLENYYVQPICSPSRSVLMSSRYQIHTGLQHSIILPEQKNGLPLENIILPEQLRQCGYDTHMVGKWHLGFYQKDYLPWNRGFNTYFGYLGGSEDYYTRERCISSSICGYDVDTENGPTNSTYGVYSAFEFTDRAKKAIDIHDKTKPMFLYLSMQSVHAPMQVPDAYIEPFAHIKDTNRRIYGGMVSVMDEAVKNVTEHLMDVGMWNDTILIFTTDNGGQTLYGGNNWPLRGRKGTLWEGGIKGVGFVHGKKLNFPNPNLKPNNELIHISDWFPTILSATNCPTVTGTQPLDGVDQWKTITSYTKSARDEFLINIDPLYSEMYTGSKFKGNTVRMGFDTSVHAGIRSGDWKLLTGEQGFDRWVKPPESSNNTFKNDHGNDKPNHPGYQINNPKLVQLYNLRYGPYEELEVSDLYPEAVDQLLKKLAAYNATAVPVRFPPNDPDSNPKYHGGYWQPWVK